MYAYVRGKLTQKNPTQIVLENSGIGYQIQVALSTSGMLKEGKDYQLATYLHVKEDQQTLYGFLRESEKRLFLLLISISGIGPNTGLVMLSSLTVNEIRQAVLEEDSKTIQSVKGIGAKTAQRVVLELRDKIQKENWEDLSQDELQPTSPTGLSQQVRQEALQALTVLGLTRAAAERSIRTVIKKHGTELTLEEIIRLALR